MKPSSSHHQQRASARLQDEYRQRELSIRRAELELKARELTLREADQQSSKWKSPLLVALAAGIVAAFANAGVSYYNGWNADRLDTKKWKQAQLEGKQRRAAEMLAELTKHLSRALQLQISYFQREVDAGREPEFLKNWDEPRYRETIEQAEAIHIQIGAADLFLYESLRPIVNAVRANEKSHYVTAGGMLGILVHTVRNNDLLARSKEASERLGNAVAQAADASHRTTLEWESAQARGPAAAAAWIDAYRKTVDPKSATALAWFKAAASAAKAQR